MFTVCSPTIVLVPGKKTVNGRGTKIPALIGAYILVGEALNIQAASLRGREPLTLGDPLLPGHYFQWMSRGRSFL